MDRSSPPRKTARKIPGVTNKRVPGSERAVRMMGGLRTEVGVQPTASQFRERHRRQLRSRSGRFSEGGWGFAWQGIDLAMDKLDEIDRRTDEAIEAAAGKIADQMLAYAKQNAPWTDHPGEHQDARDNLQCYHTKDQFGRHTIFLGHGSKVYYGVWLEVRWGGKYAIIYPTIYKFAPQFASAIRDQF